MMPKSAAVNAFMELCVPTRRDVRKLEKIKVCLFWAPQISQSLRSSDVYWMFLFNVCNGQMYLDNKTCLTTRGFIVIGCSLETKENRDNKLHKFVIQGQTNMIPNSF